MKFNILTLFPSVFNGWMDHSIIKRAIDHKNIEINLINFRNYSRQPNQAVDDYLYGGGPGMVIQLQPVVDCLKSLKHSKNHKIILLTPSGKVLNQNIVKKLSKYDELTIISGHYEGFDARIKHYIDQEISIGDFILTGGELPAMILVDAITRIQENVINKDSLGSESFEDQLLDYDAYTKPQNFDNHKVPEVLLSGNHAKIAEFRKQSRIENTKKKRPDLYNKYLRKRK